MATRYLPWLLVAALPLVNTDCTPRWTPPDRDCPGTLRPVWIADSTLTICIVTTFRTQDLRHWRRRRDGMQWDVFTLNTGISPNQAVLTGGWPPKLASGPTCATECATAESVVIRQDTVAGFLAYTEIGLVSGGMPGGQRVPMFVSSWTMTPASRATAYGWSEERATLDTLLLMLQSAQPWPPKTTQPPN